MRRKASTEVASPNAKLAEKPKRSAKAPWMAGARPKIEVRGADADGPHMDNFIQAVRSRKEPNADVVYSHYVTAMGHMGNMAYFQRKRIEWNKAWDVDSL